MPDSPFWTNSSDLATDSEISNSAKYFAGVDFSWTSDGDFCSWIRPLSHLDAFEALQSLNGASDIPVLISDLPEVSPVIELPPVMPNAFTDGS
eukprot:2522706-Karenia_brevis.AAC.1